MKELLPEYVKNNQSNQCSTSSSSSTSSSNTTEQQTTSQVDHFVKKLNLSSTASTAISKLVLSCKSSDLVGTKKTALLASMIYLVCDAATTMQRLSKSALEKKKKDEIKATTKIKCEDETAVKVKSEGSDNLSLELKRKHIRPGVGRSKKRKLADSSLNEEIDMLKPLEVVSSNSTIESSSAPTVMQSYYEWSSEKSWYRSLKQIEQSCNVTEKIICDCYKKEVYPKRKELLTLLQNCRDSSIHSDKENALLSNIASVAPLMAVARK